MSATDGTYQAQVFTGLGTLSYTVGVAGFYTVRSKSSLPTLTDAGMASSLVTTIKKNGSTVLASNPGDLGCSASGISCVVGDIITVVYSSAAASDDTPFINIIKSTVSIFQGS